jgi:SAM-dependent methyltransferase
MWDDLWENRRRLVAQLVKEGSSFLDVGGMYHIAGEISFMAERAGASRVVLFDGMDPTDEFAEKHRTNNSNVEFVQGDLHDADDIAGLGTFDVVWCAGVLYHTPNPLEQVLHLRRLTRDRLLLGSHVLPEIPGIEQACMFYPGISSEMQETFADVNRGGREQYPGMMVPFDATPLMAFANMWFGITPSALRAMLHYNGFEPIAEYQYAPFWMDVVAKPGGTPIDIYAPRFQSEKRVLDRYTGMSDEQVPPYAQAQVRMLRERGLR